MSLIATVNIIKPFTTLITNQETPNIFKLLFISVRKRTPSTVPPILPEPPAILVPPRIIHAIISKNILLPRPEAPDSNRAVNKILVMEEYIPLIIKTYINVFLTGIPEIYEAI